jgi:hypothetical protein
VTAEPPAGAALTAPEPSTMHASAHVATSSSFVDHPRLSMDTAYTATDLSCYRSHENVEGGFIAGSVALRGPARGYDLDLGCAGRAQGPGARLGRRSGGYYVIH